MTKLVLLLLFFIVRFNFYEKLVVDSCNAHDNFDVILFFVK